MWVVVLTTIATMWVYGGPVCEKIRHNTSPDIDNVQCILHGVTIHCILLHSATVISEKNLHRRRNIYVTVCIYFESKVNCQHIML